MSSIDFTPAPAMQSALGGILVRPNYVVGPNGQNVGPNLPAYSQRIRAGGCGWCVNPGGRHRPPSVDALFVAMDQRELSADAVRCPLMRNFRVAERTNLRLRGEFFNLMNHPNYALIGRVVNDPTLGIVQNQLPPREIQVALKLSF